MYSTVIDMISESCSRHIPIQHFVHYAFSLAHADTPELKLWRSLGLPVFRRDFEEVVYAGKGRNTVFWEITSKYWHGGHCINKERGQPLPWGQGLLFDSDKVDQGPAFIRLSRGEMTWHLRKLKLE